MTARLYIQHIFSLIPFTGKQRVLQHFLRKYNAIRHLMMPYCTEGHRFIINLSFKNTHKKTLLDNYTVKFWRAIHQLINYYFPKINFSDYYIF
jgi:hypothetical protein